MMSRPLWSFLLLFSAVPLHAEERKYELGPDSRRHESVPVGAVTKHRFADSKVFEETVRDYWIYVPELPAGVVAPERWPVMVFQDGHAYVNETGEFRAPVVLDNLIHQGKIPPLVAVFVNPGHRSEPLPEPAWKANNRSFEYDTLSEDYARFLLEELLPDVEQQADLKLTDDPDQRAICGISSGGICAWTVAWTRPDEFHKVLSHVGSFTNIRGGHVYPALIRKTERKPIRVFLQAGEYDLDNEHGNWWLANKQMEAALKFMQYEYRFEGGQGAHNGNHGGAILPESLVWLWRE